MLFPQNKKLPLQQVSQKKGAKKLILVLLTFMLVTIARKKTGKNDKYLETNIISVSYI